MHYYKFSIGDYRRDAAHLSLIEHGAYRQLLDQYYLDEAPLPLDADALCRRLSARTQEERAAVAVVLAEFFTRTEQGYIHQRCDEEIAQYQDRAEVARENGRLGGRRRNENQTPTDSGSKRKPTGVAKDNPAGTDLGSEREPSRVANHKPRTKNQEPDAVADGFWDFWHAMPKQCQLNCKQAKAAWNALAPDEELRAKIMGGLAVMLKSPAMTREGYRFFPKAHAFIVNERWLDAEAVQAEDEPEWLRGGKMV